ncbi:hypothetical protein [Jannaschia donghaensis]|uniref:Uncharacterized protein n=1 Tax=Jannaschia donghaensis TaxID=420998 RepID=A0A0M6YM14_9RHOB|nr:hypothetical protein [Jannaschia donghaensis]CTQ50086.1 hypothetical protein JDO7802_02104 [Jannaschia donghaensis]
MTFKMTAAAALIAMSGTAFADAHAPTMGQGFDMLQTALMSDFDRMGIPTDTLDDLTLGQLAAIKSVLEDGDESNDKGRVEAIIANN